MRIPFKWVLAGLLLAAVPGFASDENPFGWKRIFDGKTLNGWKAAERPENWTVEEGELVGQHGRSHLFYMDEMCENCEFFAEVKISHAGNSGMYFRVKEFPAKGPNGYEAQVNSTNQDPVKTGSLYKFWDITEQLISDDTWFSQHIIANGNHIIIKVDDKVVVDFVDDKNTYDKGYLALQQHNEGSVVRYRNIMFKKLPPSRK
jgi:hypothetical protein